MASLEPTPPGSAAAWRNEGLDAPVAEVAAKMVTHPHLHRQALVHALT
jgi:hypothetical protein